MSLRALFGMKMNLSNKNLYNIQNIQEYSRIFNFCGKKSKKSFICIC